jgi:hypothetical protein
MESPKAHLVKNPMRDFYTRLKLIQTQVTSGPGFSSSATIAAAGISTPGGMNLSKILLAQPCAKKSARHL